MVFRNKPIIGYLYWQIEQCAIFVLLKKMQELDFPFGNIQFIAFLKWEKKIHCFNQMRKEISLFFSKRKRYFILVFLYRKNSKSFGVALNTNVLQILKSRNTNGPQIVKIRYSNIPQIVKSLIKVYLKL